jgi:3-methyladenine DNA glycosylase AlkD
MIRKKVVSYKDIQHMLLKLRNVEKAAILKRFFKTGKGEYGEGDKFYGITVPEIRKLVQEYFTADQQVLTRLLSSPYHEERLLALLILVRKFEKGDERVRREVYEYYLKHTSCINNWDLVDLTAPKIVGAYLFGKPKHILFLLAQSKNLWERRIAILSTFHDIYCRQPDTALRISELLLKDRHDLIHKAVGWMLREVGKRCGEDIEEEFLKKYYKTMPRTMLRYAIERFSSEKRLFYLHS